MASRAMGLLVAVVALAALSSGALGRRVAKPKVSLVSWTFPKSGPPHYTDRVLNLGDKLKFVWAEKTVMHDVVQLPGAVAYAQCATTNFIGRLAEQSLTGAVTVTPFGGVSYYTCTVPGHCAAKQKIKVTIPVNKKAKTVVVPWILPKAADPPLKNVTIKAGMSVTFKWSAAANLKHDVWSLSGANNYKACSFKGALPVNSTQSLSGAVKVYPPKGTWYFACSVLGHCAARQKVVVTVK